MTANESKPVGSASDHDERRLLLLQSIADAGGRILPVADPLAERGYRYPALGDGAEGDLRALARRDCLEERFFDRVSLCPKCRSHHLNIREVCGGCCRAHLAKEGLLHHFRCGYSGLATEFPPGEDGGRTCPKCARRMHHLGTEYDRLGHVFVCKECGLISENPPAEALCLACLTRTPADDLVSIDVFGYVLTSQGVAALRRGTFAAGDEEFVSVAGAPLYPRRIILEFCDHEAKRLSSFDSRFSVLLIDCVDEADGAAPPAWLERLRRCLRAVDLVGKLTERRYLVILPQTRRRAAEALRRQILEGLDNPPPFTLSAIEITAAKDLAPIVAGRTPIDAAT
jgi:hypothetical protein